MYTIQNVCNFVGRVVQIPQVLENRVETVCWDITLGVAGTGLGQFILGATSSSADMVPDAVDHVGIIAYGYLYEYGDEGILRSPVPVNKTPKSKYPVFYMRSRDEVGKTPKLFEEFESWVDAQNKTNFAGSKYNVVDKSCIVWAREACIFLEVPYPENWDKICDWAQRNKRFAEMVGGSGMTSRRVQIKAQASETPRRIKEWFTRNTCCK